eukprot:scaffold13462_cov105-Skeletonema_dohrnii-CCMP3373.AAC.4
MACHSGADEEDIFCCFLHSSEIDDTQAEGRAIRVVARRQPKYAAQPASYDQNLTMGSSTM